MIHVLIMAGGKGTRMKSDMAKVLHPVKGVSIIERLLENVTKICEKPTLIVGYKAEDVIAQTGNKYHYVHQTEQLGTGHAVMCAEKDLKDRDIDTLVVLPGDQPLISAETIQRLVDMHKKNGATITMSTAVLEDYEGTNNMFHHYGRVIRDTNSTVDRIVEFKDASPEEKEVKEVNLSYYCFDSKWLWANIHNLKDGNAQKEYYITDLIKIARDQGKRVDACVINSIIETLGVNTPEQLKMVEEAIS